MYSPGDVILLFSQVAKKPKYQLCISLNGCFLFVNSPKSKTFPGDLEFDNADFAFLPATASGKSIVSCNLVLTMSDVELKASGATLKGTVSKTILRAIVDEIENSALLPQEQADAALDGLGDWL